MQIPKRTTAELQPLVVNFNPQYKKFVERVTEQAIQDETVRDVTNREGGCSPFPGGGGKSTNQPTRGA